MHESEERGKLLLNGKAMPQDALARLLGLEESLLVKSIDTLLSYGIASLCPDTAALMNRRMVRDEETRSIQKNFGKQGGNPALCDNYNSPGFVYLIQRSGDGKVKIGISENPTRRLYKLRTTHKGQHLELLGSFHVDDMGAVEAGLHAKYADIADGEWFPLNNSEIEETRRYLLGLPLKGKSKDNGTPSSSSSSSTSTDNKKRERPPRRIFEPPSLEEVTEYCQSRKSSVDPATWWTHYDAKGWMIGSNKMVKWKSAIATWEHKNAKSGNNRSGSTPYQSAADKREEANAEFLRDLETRRNRRGDPADVHVGPAAAPEIGFLDFEA